MGPVQLLDDSVVEFKRIRSGSAAYGHISAPAAEPFVQGADGIKILETSDSLLPEFLYHFLKANPLETDGYKRHFADLKRKTVPLPPITIQQEIIAEIERFQERIEEMNQEIVENNAKIKAAIDPANIMNPGKVL